MEKYVLQLIEQIKEAHRPVSVSDLPPQVISFEEEMEAVEKWVAGDGCPPILRNRCGLNGDEFPPPEKLTEEQMILICDAFQEMLISWNLMADFPSNLPISRAYPLMISLLEEESWDLPGGTLVFDFCTGYAPDCVMKEYCPCLKYWNED